MEEAVELSMDKGNQFVEETQSPEGAAAWKQQLDEFAPGASEWVVAAVFGGTYQREGLELRDRQILNMAALAAMGGTEPQLTGHIKTAVDVAGMSKEEVAECFEIGGRCGLEAAVGRVRARCVRVGGCRGVRRNLPARRTGAA